MLVHYNDTGLSIYVQFDDASDTRVQMTEGSTGKLRRYEATNQDLIDAGLAEGTYSVTFRDGDANSPNDDDYIYDAIQFVWDGQQETAPIVAIGESGGGILSARIGIVSLTSQDYLEVVQGEQKIITFIVEAHGRFVTSSFTSITVKFADAAGTVITKTEDDNSVQRVCEELDVQVLRCTLSEADTASLVDGLAVIEISFDDQKARLTHSLKIIETLGAEEGTGT